MEDIRDYLTQHTKNNARFSIKGMGPKESLLFLNKKLLAKGLCPIGITVKIPVMLGCNANCIMCDIRDFGPHNNFSYTQVLDIIERLDNKIVRRIKLGGGEPMMDKDGLLMVVQRCREGGFGLKFNTNGACLDEDYFDSLVDQGMTEINLSIDAPGELHDHIRGIPGLFSHLEKIVRFIRVKHPGVNIRGEAVVMNVNYDRIPALIKWAETHGFFSFTLKELDDYGKDYENLVVSKEQLEKLIREVFAMHVKMKIYTQLSARGVEKCAFFLHTLNINNDRTIAPCERYIKNPFVLKGKIEELYRDPAFNAFVLDLLNHCKRCSQ